MQHLIDPNSKAPLWLIAVLAAVTATGPMAMQIFLPALPAIQLSFQSSAALTQLTLSVSMVSIALATLVYGPLSDRYGRRPIMMWGLLLFLVGSLLCSFSPTIETLILGRAVQGVGGAAGMVLARAVARDLYGPERAASVIAQLTMVMVLAPMISPTIGGLVADTWNWRGIFLVVFIAGLVVTIAFFLLLRESHHPVDTGESSLGLLRGFGMMFSSSRFALLALYPAFSTMVFFSFAAAAPYVVVVLMGRPATEYGLYFMLIAGGFMVGNFVSLRIPDRIGLYARMQLGAGMSLAGVLLCGSILALGHLSPAGFVLPLLISQVGQGIAMPSAQAAVINLVPHRAGTASGMTGFLQMIFAAVASQAVGTYQNGTAWPLLGGMLAGGLGALTAATLVMKMGDKTPEVGPRGPR